MVATVEKPLGVPVAQHLRYYYLYRYRPCILLNPLLKTLDNVNGPFMFTNCVPGQHVYRLNRRCRNAASWFWDPSLLLVWDILTGGAKSF